MWELINGYFPTEIVAKIELEDQIFIDSILSAPIIGEEFKQFLDSTFSNLDGNKILTTIDNHKYRGFKCCCYVTKAFLTFVGKIYG